MDKPATMAVKSAQKPKFFFWGWFVVLGAFLTLFLTYGVRYSYGVFVRPMLVEYHWPMSFISIGASINILTYATFSVYCGRIVDKIAPMSMMIIGSIITAAGFLCLAYIKTPLGLYMTYGVVCGIGTACTGLVVSTAAVGKWFDKKKGLAMGFATMGMGVGTLTLSPIAGYIVNTYDWRTGFLFFGGLTFILGIAIALLFMGKATPESYGLLPDGTSFSVSLSKPGLNLNMPLYRPTQSVLRDLRFWTMVACFGLSVLTVMMTFVHQVAYAIEQNIGRIEAAAALGLVGLSASFGKFFFGWLCDKMRDAKYAAALGFLIMAIGMFVLLKAHTARYLYIYALIYGIGYGSLAPVMPYLVANRFGRHVLGSAFGALTFFVVGIGGSIGPVLGGIIYDLHESYASAWIMNTVILLFVSVLILTLRPVKISER